MSTLRTSVAAAAPCRRWEGARLLGLGVARRDAIVDMCSPRRRRPARARSWPRALGRRARNHECLAWAAVPHSTDPSPAHSPATHCPLAQSLPPLQARPSRHGRQRSPPQSGADSASSSMPSKHAQAAVEQDPVHEVQMHRSMAYAWPSPTSSTPMESAHARGESPWTQCRSCEQSEQAAGAAHDAAHAFAAHSSQENAAPPAPPAPPPASSAPPVGAGESTSSAPPAPRAPASSCDIR